MDTCTYTVHRYSTSVCPFWPSAAGSGALECTRSPRAPSPSQPPTSPPTWPWHPTATGATEGQVRHGHCRCNVLTCNAVWVQQPWVLAAERGEHSRVCQKNSQCWETPPLKGSGTVFMRWVLCVPPLQCLPAAEVWSSAVSFEGCNFVGNRAATSGGAVCRAVPQCSHRGVHRVHLQQQHCALGGRGCGLVPRSEPQGSPSPTPCAVQHAALACSKLAAMSACIYAGQRSAGARCMLVAPGRPLLSPACVPALGSCASFPLLPPAAGAGEHDGDRVHLRAQPGAPRERRSHGHRRPGLNLRLIFISNSAAFKGSSGSHRGHPDCIRRQQQQWVPASCRDGGRD